MTGLRVLYVHGLESGPQGRKVRALAAAGLDVRAPQMPCGARRAAEDPAGMWSDSLDVQREALAHGPIDVVVGSSFGGAVTLALLHEAVWAGPTVLLCPAHRLMADRLGAPALPGLAALPDRGAEVLVVHGRQDAIVPVAHSRELVLGSSARLIEVDDDHPLTATATPDGLRGWVARVTAPS